MTIVSVAVVVKRKSTNICADMAGASLERTETMSTSDMTPRIWMVLEASRFLSVPVEKLLLAPRITMSTGLPNLCPSAAMTLRLSTFVDEGGGEGDGDGDDRGVGLGVGEEVGDGVGERVGDGAGEEAGVGVGDSGGMTTGGVGEGVGVTVGVGVGVGGGCSGGLGMARAQTASRAAQARRSAKRQRPSVRVPSSGSP
jgi:hypothetical protein